ncbi:universal stress protein [Brevibacillus fluminis]|uniref:Universal stress protein n=1 Tax=Brevibacillus fluminis TaxID=511487 RepID=A0A3M8DG27_9BACL|nr:universal stress protein [Brevibacillus fluminis]RNB87033.1 universal stress protein [Brevibacillus fluminis]
MTKLLVPIDASERSQQAVRLATAIAADKTDASLTLLHVLSPLPPGKTVTFIDPEQFTRYQKEDAMEHLQPSFELVENSRVPYTMNYEVGITHEAIGNWAQEHDMIVMGTHGYGRVAGWMLGSIGYPLLHHLPVPIILVPEETESVHAPKRILIAVDGSDHARYAAEAAIQLGKKTGAEFVLFTAVGYSFPHAEELSEDIHEKLVTSGERIIAAYEPLLRASGVTYTTKVAIGDPSLRIKEAAEQEHIDLVALGYHGTSGLTDLLVGSTVYKVIHRTTKPLLIVRS